MLLKLSAKHFWFEAESLTLSRSRLRRNVTFGEKEMLGTRRLVRPQPHCRVPWLPTFPASVA